MVKTKTGRQNYYKLLLNDLYIPGRYQRYLGVEHQTTKQIDEYLEEIRLQKQPNKNDAEIIYEKIVKRYPRITCIIKLAKPMKVIYRPSVPEVVTLE
jgi:hypothetical protein